MKVFALGDLHLSFTQSVTKVNLPGVPQHKPMSCFGPGWQDHGVKIFNNWSRMVDEEDLVLVPGDISWAMKLAETVYDFQYLSLLPGKKVLVQGNHDYWWHSISKVRSALPDGCYALQNDSFSVPGVTIVGTRGWLTPNNRVFTQHDEKIYRREIQRLELSLKSMKQRQPVVIAMFHYMPTNQEHQCNELIELLKQYRVDICIYGHLHGAEAHSMRLPARHWGIDFYLTAADFVHFAPMRII
ncbi:metallophosphoesterase [Metallumcola ferriviriculae]|uniref:Metallophosphoesterase n=1 Tax=Metallumcola ferriviriculae TaxID=3039180 RepID=A0AAU0UPE8_9FIRM|nr:metallophosphoesterase [Desulfitibacteraceae bacterium MK1]